jgi:hypothetical protein
MGLRLLTTGCLVLSDPISSSNFQFQRNGVFSSGQGPAYEPWKDWKTESEEGAGPLSLVASAILAANAHNTQPWLFVVNPNKIDLFADTRRNIGAIDPYLREMYEGLGCALENLVVAAESKGYTYNLKLMPNPTSKTHVATINFHIRLLVITRIIKAKNVCNKSPSIVFSTGLGRAEVVKFLNTALSIFMMFQDNE